MNKILHLSYTQFTATLLVVGIGISGLLYAHNVRAAVGDLLPNLVALPAMDIRVVSDGNSSTLRFSTLSWNNGTGAVEIEGGATTSPQRQAVYQNIYQDDGSIRQRQAGEYVYHENHSHIHFEEYADYTLQPAGAPLESARFGHKTSFCLMDTSRVDTKLPGASKKSTYNSCSDDVQGISVGWGDKYGYQLAGQEIDITNIADGNYNLIIDVNPQGRLLESDMTDNQSVVKLRIENGTVNVITDADSEPTRPGNGRGRNR